MSEQIQDFLKVCELDTRHSLDLDAFRDLCSRLNLPTQDIDLVFEDLDLDRDGKINFADFSKGFSTFLVSATNATQGDEENCVCSAGSRSSDDAAKFRWLLGELQTSEEQRHLVPLLEGAVDELIRSLHRLQEEKASLEESWTREKLEHQRHLKRMEEELDNQVKEVEIRMRMKAQEEVEGERKSLQTKMDTELDKLAAIEKVFSWFRTQCPPPHQGSVSRLDEVRAKLSEAAYDNHQLRMSLLDTQTNIALMRSELVQLRTLYEEKCRELSSEKERILEVLQEQDHLSKQLNLLHDANRRLLDSNDALKSSVFELNSSAKQQQQQMAMSAALTRAKSGSIIGDYLELNYSRECLDRCSEEDSDSNEEEHCSSQKVQSEVKVDWRRFKESESSTGLMNQSDSGISSIVKESIGPWEEEEVENANEMVVQEEGRVTRTNSRKGSRSARNVSVPPPEHRRVVQGCSSSHLRSSASEDSLLDVESSFPIKKIADIKKQLGIQEDDHSWRRSWQPYHCSTPREHAMPPTPMPRLSKMTSRDKMTLDLEVETGCSMEVDESEFEPDPGQPVNETFKVIFVGDAGVGKSSFALRISKGVFVGHTSSTLGLDFLMRTLRVDHRNVAVQLWDTAGQERFRSITKSYFRKADGVLLLYDCTCEQSFLNVRGWVEDIDVVCFYNMMSTTSDPSRRAAFNRIPLMIVANKVDLREMALRMGITCITTEQGEKLAKDCNTTFIEASAKDGSNVLAAIANLVRSMSNQQDTKLSTSTMQLCEPKSNGKKSGCCGGKGGG